MDSNRSTGNSPTEVPRAYRPSVLLGAGRTAWIAGSISLAFAIVLGAFGAHAMEAALPPDRLDAFETASQYHFYSCFFLFALALTRARSSEVTSVTQKALGVAQTLWGWGTVVFCGSVYLVSVRGLIGLEGASWLGAIAPLGGLLLIAGAAYGAYVIFRSNKDIDP